MKLCFFILFTAFICCQACSQYYYNDIVALKETNRQYQAIKNARITNITAQSFEANGQATEGFLLKQEVGNGGNTITTTSGISSAAESVSVNYYDGTHLVKTVDNSTNIISTVEYGYDAAGNIETIRTTTVDTFMNSNSEELHEWKFAGNQPTAMLRIKDKSDTTTVEFVKDEQGNIAEEHWKKKGKTVENYFYYYNDAHQLTDIVRYNTVAKRMLPDFLFNYNEAGLVTQLTQVHLNTGSYLIWKYSYNTNNLKQTETCFDKKKELVGRIEYNYR
ncbi:MAG TPA: hypothetical protein VHB48_13700 [Chitinophagaceae bacterium]|jgi:hypothetical protein|nr:hypothetical protein [Chitinophagaceae bacterium]